MKASWILGGGRRLDGPILLLITSAGLGILAAYQRGPAWTALGWIVSGGLVYALLSRLGAAARSQVLRIATLGLGLVSLYLLAQIGHYADLEKVALVERVTDWIAGVTPDLAVWRPMPNSAATLLEGLLFAGIGTALSERDQTWRRALWTACGLAAAALVASQSRGAWIAAAGAGLLWGSLRFRPVRYITMGLALASLALAGIVLISGDLGILARIPLADRILSPVFARPDRLEVYRGGLQLIADLPFSGVGLGPQFAMNYSKFVLLIQVPYLTYSHHFFLESWLELGLVGMAAVVWLTGAVAAAGRRLVGSSGSLAHGIWAGVAAMLLHGLTDARMYADGWCWLPFFFLLGLLAGGEGPIQAGRRTALWSVNWALGLAGLLLIGGLVGLPHLSGAWWANQGALKQARAELTPHLEKGERAVLRAAAETDFRRSLAQNPAGRSANLRLGLLLCSQERFTEALAPLEAALRADPGNPTSRKALGLAYMWVGRVDDATALVRDARKMTEELNAWGAYRAGRGQIDLARRAYLLSLRLNGRQEDVRLALKALD